jgi:hypothetical protein
LRDDYLTSVDLLAVHDQVVDVVLNVNEGLVLGCLLFLANFHEPSDVPWEEVRLDSVDDVEEVLSVDGLIANQIRQIALQLSILESISQEIRHCQLWHLWNVDNLDFLIEKVLQRMIKGRAKII